MSKKITVKIDALGRPTVSGTGFVGAECDAAMLPIEQALAGGKGIRVDSPDYYQGQGQQQEVKQSW